MKYTPGKSCPKMGTRHDFKVTKSAPTYYVAVCRRCGSSKTVYRYRSKKAMKELFEKAKLAQAKYEHMEKGGHEPEPFKSVLTGRIQCRKCNDVLIEEKK